MKTLSQKAAKIVFAGGLAIALDAIPTARAEDLPPITSTDYALELFDGGIINTSRVVAMGGASLALTEGSAGSQSNPSATAVRASTDSDRFTWDFHLEAASQRYTTDFDNNGIKDKAAGKSALIAGLSFGLDSWGIAIGVSQRTTSLGQAGSQQASLERADFSLARFFSNVDLALGITYRVGSFVFNRDEATELFRIEASTLVAGITWLPKHAPYRLAATLVAPSIGGSLESSRCDPTNCLGYILPQRVALPGSIATAIGYRFGTTRWNIKVPNAFRDEHSLLVAAELNITGPSNNAFGVEAFSMQQLQRSGRRVSLSPRAGFEYEALPGRLRLRGGSYWEPGRFDGVSGRVHGTAGIELALFGFHLWGPRRAKITLTADIASAYVNGGASIGLWH